MPTKKPRAGSLQIWPRKRAAKFLPSANWAAFQEEERGKGLLGLVAYKVGMKSALVKDLTQDSMTKDKRIIVPVSILEIPPIRIYSARLYKNGICKKEIILSIEKQLNRVIKIGKDTKIGNIQELDKKDFDDLRVIVYSKVFSSAIKKTPDVIEMGLGGSIDDKISFVKEHSGKDIFASEILKKMQLVDVRGLSKGKGFESAVKRFGIGLKSHKAEKGQRRPGSLGPWHPHHVSFRVSQAGQLGMQTRLVYNLKLLEIGKISEKNINPAGGWEHFGNIKTDYAIVYGSVPGPAKRQLLVTQALRRTKKQNKKNLELLKLE